uniref:Uncharacterized protein n=1 Tax=Anguilla anguilla TaxID=7936 RepID=A0A0E9PMF5_ANGAN
MILKLLTHYTYHNNEVYS